MARISNESAERALAITERAYIQMTDVLIRSFDFGRSPEFKIRLHNSGHTMAHIESLNVVLAFIKAELPPVPNYNNAVTPPAVMMAGETLEWNIPFEARVSKPNVQDIVRERRFLYVYGLVIYRDVFDKTHKTGFGRRYDSLKSNQAKQQIFVFCRTPGYNYAD